VSKTEGGGEIEKDEGAKGKKGYEILRQRRPPVAFSEWRRISTVASDGFSRRLKDTDTWDRLAIREGGFSGKAKAVQL
jgi:hypothetical protein